MTESAQRRQRDQHRLLRLMVESIGDGLVGKVRFQGQDSQFADILPTTWAELEADGFVGGMHSFGAPAYRLTESGWLEGLRVAGELNEDTQTWRRAQTASLFRTTRPTPSPLRQASGEESSPGDASWHQLT
jgi:hypothetical protein